eukprot:TRINITY_DN3062_c0_g1_i1.p1 TRINITY_DN3062_c0_g1~~TRINITY_DN3062_c0_g1_i1.p1  ORF type:complete len:232 (-),score=57.24 TRINITY_DN3062_c0_g1_i1:712-1386(-)
MSHGMNIFRILGDFLHLFSFIVLILKIRSQRSCEGISVKTQQLYLVVFLTRYLDLPWNILHFTPFSLYLACFKIIFIGSTAMIIYLMMFKYKRSYSKDQDWLPLYFLMPPCLVLAFVWNEGFTVFEILWAFSIFLEAITILPQLVLLQSSGNVENLTSHYVAALGGYRALYLINWIYRFATEKDYSHWLVWVAGLVQTAIYVDFFYYYFQSYKKGSKMTLPTSV